jgi:hypothetical protein
LETRGKGDSGHGVEETRMDLRTLPTQLAYLRDYLRFLDTLDPEDVNEDTDTIPLDEAIRSRAAACGDGWEAQREADLAALAEWLEEEPDQRAVGSFVLSLLETFEVGGPSARDVEENARIAKSGFIVDPLLPGESVDDEFGRLDIRLPDGVLGCVMKLDYMDFLFRQLTSRVPGMRHSNRVEEVQFGPWSGKKLVQTQEAPAAFRNVSYFLNDGNVDVLAKAFRKNLRPFDESGMEALLARMVYTRPKEDADCP